MPAVRKKFDDLYVTGRSPFSFSYGRENVKFGYHSDCLKSEKSKNDFIPRTNSCWFLNDHHVDSDLKVYQSLKALDRLGQKINSIRYDNCEKEVDIIKPVDVDEMARKYFPVTLGKSFEIEAQIHSDNQPPWTVTFSPPPNGLPRPESPWRVPTIHNRVELDNKWTPTEKYVEDNLHFLSSSPVELTSDLDQMGLIHTPYQADLSKLRLDRLRLEDEILMEVKRQDELERIRGPEPKWYELRDSRFHYEAKKNNELLKSCDNWQTLFDYRNKLKKKSEEFQTKYISGDKIYDPTNYIPVS